MVVVDSCSHEFCHRLYTLKCFFAESRRDIYTQAAMIELDRSRKERGAELLKDLCPFERVDNDVIAFGELAGGFEQELGHFHFGFLAAFVQNRSDCVGQIGSAW